MAIPHWNDFSGGYEYLDNPLEDCDCAGCVQGRADLWGEVPSGSSANAAKRIAQSIVSGAIALYGAYEQPQQHSTETQTKWGESQLEREGRNRGDQATDATRDKGYRTRWSGRND